MEFEIDNEAIELSPHQTLEFNSKFINFQTNLYLVHNKNCIISSIDQRVYQIECLDGSISLDSIRKAILTSYFESRFNFLLAFIKRKNGKLCVELLGNRIEIELYFPVPFFKEILESYFIPLKINSNQFLKLNDHSILYPKHNFIINRNQIQTVNLLKKKWLTYTCFSHPNFIISRDSYFDGYVYRNTIGSFIYFLRIKNEELLKMLYRLRREVQKALPLKIREFVVPSNSFILKEQANEDYDNMIDLEIERVPNVNKQEIQIAYCDFRPNKEIVESIVGILVKYGFRIETIAYQDLKIFLQESFQYDISLNISHPIINHKYGIALSLLNDLEDCKKDIAKSCIKQNNYQLFEGLFDSTNSLLPIFQSKNVYFKRNNVSDINQYGGID